MRTYFLLILACAAPIAWACGPQTPPEAAPVADPDRAPSAAPSEELPGSPEPQRARLSSQECAAQGGVEVGDIGDGAIHRPEYICANGEPPLGSIQPSPGQPIATEGSVCCPQ